MPKFIKGSKVYKASYIYQDILYHLENKKPFSIVRFGDGDFFVLQKNLQKANDTLVSAVYRKQGFTERDVPDIVNMYRKAANNANYISSWERWFSGWHMEGIETIKREWKQIYERIGIKNNNYCHPHLNLFLFLDGEFNLLKALKDKRICLVTAWTGALDKLKKNGYDAEIIEIPAKGTGRKTRAEMHINKFKGVKNRIEKRIKDFDIFLVCGGTFARGYCDFIKRSGGVAIDSGKVVAIWAHGNIKPKMGKFFSLKDDGLTFQTKLGKDLY